MEEGFEGPYRSRRPLVTTVLSVLGLAVASYLTLTHYSTAVTLVCSTTGGINCEKVTTSPQSVIFGIPVAVLGLAFFVPMLLLCLPVAWRSANRYIAPARLALSISGVGFICYLLYAELYVIHAICLWCTSVHLLTLLLFIVIATGWDDAMVLRESSQTDPDPA